MTFTASDEQDRAIRAGGTVFVSAGAGTGKTSVLVERFALAVAERNVAPDRICAITYTERAAAELSARVRTRLREAGGPDLERALDGAWISTIHGFCTRVLRRYALEAGIDPAFVVLDASAADILRGEAYDSALAVFCGRGGSALDLVVAYGEDRLRVLIDQTHQRLRTGGVEVRFPEPAVVPLESLLEAVVAEAAIVAALPGQGVSVSDARAAVAALVELIATDRTPSALADLAAYRVGARVEAASAYDAALDALERGARDAVYADVRPLLDELLGLFSSAYAARKRAASLLDFDDLQLEVRDLLERSEAIRDELRARFGEVMVDEFQDTNELQCAIIDGIAQPGAPLFFVGDEFQSIYRFRHADVDVFRRRQAESRAVPGAAAIALRTNYRSRPEVLAVVNHLFETTFGSDFEPLTAGGAFAEFARVEPAVEFLVTDADRAKVAGLEPREAEARALALRLQALLAAGDCRAGEIVLLFSAGTDADIYERALHRVGIDTVAATGRRYFETQAVRDLLAYLRLVRNRYDDVAFLAAVASPLVGVTNDTLALLRAAAPNRPLYTAIENAIPTAIPEADARLLAAFRQRFDRLVTAASRIGLAALVERVVDEHDYDLALLASEHGPRRIANVRKLVRIAREFEALRGPDVERFVETVEVRRLASDREPDAIITEEEADAVRLMTIHAAKGLEFRVVVVADSGRAAATRSDHLVALPDGRVGVKIPDASGQLHATSAYVDARAAEQVADDDERRRVSYVALTRAIDRLIVSGHVSERSLASGSTPIAWMLQRLGASLAPEEIAVPGGSVAIRVAAFDEKPHDSPDHVDIETLGQLSLFADPSAVEPLPPPFAIAVPPPLEPLPEEPEPRPGRLSFSSLHLHERCGFRFHAERVLGFRPGRRPPTADGVGLTGAELGSAVHDILEFPDRDPAVVLACYPTATADDRERIAMLVERWTRSELAQVLAGGTIQREVPFLLAVGDAQLAGRLDLLARTDGRAHVVDYKSNRLDGADPATLRDGQYGLQEAVYALALLERGEPVVDVHFAILDADVVLTRTYDQGGVDAVRATVGAAVEAARTGPYVPRPGIVCEDCPVLGLLCAGPDLDHLHGPPDQY